MKDMLEHKVKTFSALWETLRDISVSLSTQTAALTDANSEADERAEFEISNNATLIRPLIAAVTQAAMNESDACGFHSELPLIIRGLNKLVATSEAISNFGSTAVLGLTPEIVMKVGEDIDISHLHTLDHIKHHAPRVPIPDIRGILQQSNSNRIFFLMSRAPGEPLYSKLKSMGEDEKASIRRVLVLARSSVLRDWSCARRR
ncbi:hypothetical protein N7481_001870 [Penicillium waksmanii]|uniref:uncharacterized protein n=1 Tax=Penicillium waksmanii TaxID=69791 RepID=UPI0025471332|nr:uncharacterized protein N7481_001870 [Penicillium waksmanii]KAJ5994893.1 hypothetical protein N7481_001870 [Penicillium waksmanii]